MQKINRHDNSILVLVFYGAYLKLSMPCIVINVIHYYADILNILISLSIQSLQTRRHFFEQQFQREQVKTGFENCSINTVFVR